MIFKIPHFGLDRQYINLKDELLHVTDLVLSTGTLVGGEYTADFEDWLCHQTGCTYAITVHSGTQALEILSKYLLEETGQWARLNGLPANYRIAIPNLTYPATLNAFLSTGWNTELHDTDSNGLMRHPQHSDLSLLSCFVGLFGARTDDKLWSVYDGAQNWLTILDGRVGTGMAISFDPTKNLNASGNGGAIVTNLKAVQVYANKIKDNGKPNFELSGTNSKLSELDAAHLLVRSNYLPEWQERRGRIRHYYIDRFKDLPIRCLSEPFEVHADQKFVIAIETGSRDGLNFHMQHHHGIETKIHYPYALSELPVAKNLIKPDSFTSVSVALSRMILSLPIYPELTDSEIEIIADKVCHFWHK